MSPGPGAMIRAPGMQNFYEQFARVAARLPEGVAVEVQRRDRVDRFTYSTLEAMAGQTTAWLAAEGIGRGDRCAILAENDAHWCAAYLGVLRLGAVAVPLDTAYKAPQVATLLRDSGARVIFTSPRHLDTVLEGRDASGRADVRVVLLHGASGDLPRFEVFAAVADAGVPEVPGCPCEPGDPAVILYTSGTTSDPKGVVLTHGNLLAERDGALAVVHVSERDCVLGVLPLFHALAQMANLLLPFAVGARVVFLETVNTSELLRGLAERGVTIFVCVPQFFYLIHQRVMQEVARAGAPKRLVFRGLLAANGALRTVGLNAGRVLFSRVHRVLGGSMRILITGGSRFDPAIGDDLFRLGFNILQAYGLTETSGAVTIVRPGDSHLGSVGQPLPNVGDEGAAARVQRRGGEGRRGARPRADRHGRLLQSAGCHGGRHPGRLVPHRRPRTDRRRGAADDHRAQEGNHRPQQRQEHLPRGGRGALPAVAVHQGDLRARREPAWRTERRAPLRGRRPRCRRAARAQDRERRRPDPVRDGRAARSAWRRPSGCSGTKSGWSRCLGRPPAS